MVEEASKGQKLSSSACPLCQGAYKNSKRENLIRHVALAHGKLDELLKDEDFVAKKKQEFLSSQEPEIKQQIPM